MRGEEFWFDSSTPSGKCRRKNYMVQAGNTRICGNCGTRNAATDQFCSNCGYTLAGGSTGQTVQSVQATSAQTVSTGANRRITGTFPPGNVLGGRYRMVEMIGKGGFGAVYKATDERFQSRRVVAIKEMSDAQLGPQEKAKAIQDFRQEADLLVELSHPNLPNVSDFFEEGDKAYLVMEFIQGKTLEKVQEEKHGPLDESEVMGWALQLCTVLHYLHTRPPHPIIFRDMKPGNVMVTGEGQIKLIDFGIARIFKVAGKKDTTLLGSQGYAPLEQYGRGQSDPRSDIYALGATLYDLLTNEVPTDAPTRRVHPQIFESPRGLNPNISPGTEQIVLKAMAEDPNGRYQSALEMYQAIAATGIATTSGTLLPTSNTLPNMPAVQAAGASGVPVHSTPQQTKTQIPATTAASGTGRPQAGQQPQQTQRPQQAVARQVPPVPPVQQPSFVPPPAQRGGVGRRGFLVGCASVVGLAAIGGTALYLSSHNKSTPGKGPVSSGTGTVGTLTLDFIYSTEKADWMKAVIQDFNNSNSTIGNQVIQINGDGRGSGDAKERILSGELKPIAWSPASDLELNQLLNAWKQKHNNQEIYFTSGDLAPQSLLLSPLVFAIWKDRGKILLDKYQTIDWPQIHDALQVNSWGDIGGQSAWGPVKLGQTRPDSSNSGLLSVTLIAYSFYKKSRGLTVADIQNAEFLKYLTDIEGAVNKFGKSSGTYLSQEVILNGPSSYDVVTTYENLVLTLQKPAQQRNGQAFQPFYPTQNIVSNHPFAILRGDWVTQAQQEAAQKFRSFLLDAQQQRKALVNGFRPVNSSVSITDSMQGNPFTDKTLGFTIPTQLPTQVAAPNGDVVDELLKQWLAKYSSAPTALSITSDKEKGTIYHDIRA